MRKGKQYKWCCEGKFQFLVTNILLSLNKTRILEFVCVVFYGLLMQTCIDFFQKMKKDGMQKYDPESYSINLSKSRIRFQISIFCNIIREQQNIDLSCSKDSPQSRAMIKNQQVQPTIKDNEVLKEKLLLKEQITLEQNRMLEELRGRMMMTRQELELATRRGHELGGQLTNLMYSTASSLQKTEVLHEQTGRTLEIMHAERLMLRKKLKDISEQFEAKLEDKSKEISVLGKQVSDLKIEVQEKDQTILALSHALEEARDRQGAQRFNAPPPCKSIAHAHP